MREKKIVRMWEENSWKERNEFLSLFRVRREEERTLSEGEINLNAYTLETANYYPGNQCVKTRQSVVWIV